MSNTDNDTVLSEYERYVLDSLYRQEERACGRELTLAEQRKIRGEYIGALRASVPHRKRGYKRAIKPDDMKDFTWTPSVSMRRIKLR
ncbi:Uncharacterised protein [Citrobacter freundii]|nr:Uncharacterised protein [Citrobacter freundii]